MVQTPPPPTRSTVRSKANEDEKQRRDTNIHPNELLFFVFRKPNSSSSQSHDLRRADHRKTNEKVVVSLPESVVNLVCKCVCECVCECMYVCMYIWLRGLFIQVRNCSSQRNEPTYLLGNVLHINLKKKMN